MLLQILTLLFPLTICMPQSGPPETRCSDHVDYGYYCVPYYQCNAENKIITDGVGLVDPRTTDDLCDEPDPTIAITSKCTKLLEVCCRHPGFTLPPSCENEPDYDEVDEKVFNDDPFDTDDEDDDIFDTDDEDDDIFDTDDEDDDIFDTEDEDGGIFDTDYEEEEDEIFTEPNSPGQCGKRNGNGLTNAIGEASVDEAKFGEWPHVCAVLKKEYIGTNEKPLMVYQCGASMIADSVILTAAHCVNDTESLEGNLVVRCGEWDTQSEDEKHPYQEVDVARIMKHPDFNVDNHHNNFAVLFLEYPFTLSPHISPVCLPKPEEEFSNQNCVSHGWGKDKFGAEGRYSTILKEVVVPLVKNEKCQKDLRDNTRLGTYFELDNSFICAGGQKDIDTCKGDGGSPLTCRQPRGPWFQAGIVSWGIGCGENNTPAVYANVAKASCWIDKAVQCYKGMKESYFGFDNECTESTNC